MSIDFSSVEMRRLVQKIGSATYEGEHVYLRIERVSRRLDIPSDTAKKYWYEERKPDPQHFIAAKKLCGEPIEEATGHDFSGLQKQVTELERQLVRARQDIDSLLDSANSKSDARRGSETDLFGQDNRSLA